ncbi:MAG: RNA polymerase sigma factor [Ruminococcaceae bacterium]|nr:RNA polymerase sigma factor [Oscillospiraceae bacterium]
MNEDEIIKQLKKDSLKALNEMITRYTPFVSSVIGRILRNMERDIDELTQDVFLTAWKNRKKIESGKLKSYLAVIARNKAFDLLRKEHEDLPLEEDILIFDDENIELKIEQKELSRLLDEALRELPTAQRELFVRHYYYGQSVAEASAEMDINESTAKSWLKRGREKLKDILIEKGAVDLYFDDECKIKGQPVENT